MTPPPVNRPPEAGSRRGVRRDRPGAPRGVGVPVPEWGRDPVVYCVSPRAFDPAGTLEAVTRRLPEIRALGATVVWLLPIHPVGVVGRKGRLGSPYAIRDDRAVDPALGTIEDLKALVDEAHRLGLRVLMDAVFNHMAPDHVARAAHPDWFVRDARGRLTRRVADWSDVVDRNFAATGLAESLLDTLAFWVETCGVDGFRCDVAGMVPAEFWRRARERLLAVRPDHLLLAEWDDPALHRTAFHLTYDWHGYRTLLAAARGRAPVAQATAALTRRAADFPEGAVSLRFVENHDEPRVVRRFGAAARAVTLVQAMAGGAFLVFNGQEVGARRRPDLFDRDPIDWHPPGAGAARVELGALLEARRDVRHFGAPEALPEDAGVSPDVLSFARRAPDGRSLVVLANVRSPGVPLGKAVGPWLSQAGARLLVRVGSHPRGRDDGGSSPKCPDIGRSALLPGNSVTAYLTER
jgi:glycosidase